MLISDMGGEHNFVQLTGFLNDLQACIFINVLECVILHVSLNVIRQGTWYGMFDLT